MNARHKLTRFKLKLETCSLGKIHAKIIDIEQHPRVVWRSCTYKKTNNTTFKKQEQRNIKNTQLTVGPVLPLAAHAKKIIRVIARKYRITSQDNCIEIRICLLKKKKKEGNREKNRGRNKRASTCDFSHVVGTSDWRYSRTRWSVLNENVMTLMMLRWNCYDLSCSSAYKRNQKKKEKKHKKGNAWRILWIIL